MAIFTQTISAPWTGNHSIESFNGTYATCRTGSGLVALTSGSIQSAPGFVLDVTLVEFDTSALIERPIGAALEVSFASASQFGEATPQTLHARLYDFGATIETADWPSSAAIAASPLLATLLSTDTTDDPSTFCRFKDVAMAANLVLGGTTRIMLIAQGHVNNVQPVSSTWWSMSVVAGAPRLVLYYKDNAPVTTSFPRPRLRS